MQYYRPVKDVLIKLEKTMKLEFELHFGVGRKSPTILPEKKVKLYLRDKTNREI